MAAAHLDPTTRQRVLGHYVLWRDHYHWVLHAPGGGSDMEYREVMGLVEIVAKPDPQATTEADWDTDIGDRLTVGALTGLRYGGTICDAPIRVFGQHHDAAPEH